MRGEQLAKTDLCETRMNTDLIPALKMEQHLGW